MSGLKVANLKFWLAITCLTISPLFGLTAAYQLMTVDKEPRPFMTHGLFTIAMFFVFLGLWLLS